MDVIRKTSGNFARPNQYAVSNEEPEQNTTPPRQKKSIFGKLLRALPWLAIIICLAAAGAGYYFYRQAQIIKKEPQAQQAGGNEDMKTLLAAVGQLIVLPQDEDPTVATVTDLEKLKDQPFFANAKLGDKVLIWSKAKKVILYDPVANKLVEVAPLNVSGQQ